MSPSANLLEARDLRTELQVSGGIVRALDGVDLDLPRGETFAIVGESGCGKSMTALTLMRLLPETGRVASGSVRLDGAELLSLPERRMRDVRGRRVAMIFQEPATSLNPVLTVGTQIAEVLTRQPAFAATPRAPGRSSCSTRSESPTARAGSTTTHSSSRAG
jgi:ABC-type dipeptide/oligopeptide/nickel transport system ATPase component